MGGVRTVTKLGTSEIKSRFSWQVVNPVRAVRHGEGRMGLPSSVDGHDGRGENSLTGYEIGHPALNHAGLLASMNLNCADGRHEYRCHNVQSAVQAKVTFMEERREVHSRFVRGRRNAIETRYEYLRKG